MSHISICAGRMARYILVLTALLVAFLSSVDNAVVQAKMKNNISCSCTMKSNKVMLKSAQCKAGISKNECCTKAARASSSIRSCKYAQTLTPELGGGLTGNGAGQPSNKCKPSCNTAAGSQCIQTSGGVATAPQCTCTLENAATQCKFPNLGGWSCSNSQYILPNDYHGYICTRYYG